MWETIKNFKTITKVQILAFAGSFFLSLFDTSTYGVAGTYQVSVFGYVSLLLLLFLVGSLVYRFVLWMKQRPQHLPEIQEKMPISSAVLVPPFRWSIWKHKMVIAQIIAFSILSLGFGMKDVYLGYVGEIIWTVLVNLSFYFLPISLFYSFVSLFTSKAPKQKNTQIKGDSLHGEKEAWNQVGLLVAVCISIPFVGIFLWATSGLITGLLAPSFGENAAGLAFIVAIGILFLTFWFISKMAKVAKKYSPIELIEKQGKK